MQASLLLSLIIFMPLLGVGFILLTSGEKAIAERNARWVALWTSVINFVLSLFLWTGFEIGAEGFQFVEQRDWMPALGTNYHLGVDGISVLFVLLSTFLTPVCILASWDSVTHRVKEYMIAFLLLETMMVGMFCAVDLLVFYIFFEGVLIPMFLIIGVWGGPRRIYAAFKFFLYTLLGSVLMLLAVLAIWYLSGTTDIAQILDKGVISDARALELARLGIDPITLQCALWLAFFASFAVKVPMWPVHTWLPDAHVEAPTAGSVILAGVLLKMGGYGFLRFSIPMLPDATIFFTPMVFALSVMAIIYTSLVALAQTDMKKLIAYSSVAHMGFVTMGLFSLARVNADTGSVEGLQQGIEGGMFQMLSHGIVSAALFLCVGVVYDRLHTREIQRYGGLVNNMPRYALVFMVFTMASVGLPGTSGFVGEFLSLAGAFLANPYVAMMAASGLVLGAAYMLWLYRRVVFGKLTKVDVRAMADLHWREALVFAPMLALVMWMGIRPGHFTRFFAPEAERIAAAYEGHYARVLAAAEADRHLAALTEDKK